VPELKKSINKRDYFEMKDNEDNVIKLCPTNIGKYKIIKGKYTLHNGMEFFTKGEVGAFIRGLEYALNKVNAGIDASISNALHDLHDDGDQS